MATLAVKILGQLASGLGRKGYAPYAAQTVATCLGKFKEKKPTIVSVLRETVDAAMRAVGSCSSPWYILMCACVCVSVCMNISRSTIAVCIITCEQRGSRLCQKLVSERPHATDSVECDLVLTTTHTPLNLISHSSHF